MDENMRNHGIPQTLQDYRLILRKGCPKLSINVTFGHLLGHFQDNSGQESASK